MTIKAILLDLDDVLIHEGFDHPIICDETMQVLNYLKENNHKIVSNIQTATTLNIHGLLVDNKTGISLKQLKDKLELLNLNK